MIKEYSLYDKLKYEFSNKVANLSIILNLLTLFIRVFQKNATTLLLLIKIKPEIDKLSKFVNLIQNGSLIELIEYCDINDLHKLSATLNQLRNIVPTIKIKNIKKYKVNKIFTVIFKRGRQSPEVRYLILKSNALIVNYLSELYQSCYSNKDSRLELYKVSQQDSMYVKAYEYFKPKVFSLNFIVLVGIFVFGTIYVLIILSLEGLHLSALTNYVDVLPLVFRAKVFFIAIIIVISVVTIINSMPMNQILLDEKFQENDLAFGCGVILKFILLVGICWGVNVCFLEPTDWNSLSSVIKKPVIGFIVFLILSFIEYVLYNKNKATTVKRYFIILLGQLSLLLYSLPILLFSVVTSASFNNHIITTWIVFYILFVLVHMLEVYNYMNTSKTIWSRVYIISLFVFFVVSIFVQRTSILTFVDAGYSAQKILLINIETDSDNFANKLRINGVREVGNTTSNIYTNELDLKAHIMMSLKQDINPQDCLNLIQQSILAKRIVENKSMQFNSESLCKASISNLSQDEKQKYNLMNIYFSVYKVSPNRYNYWIYGVNVPFFLQNKVISLTIPSSKFIYTLETENGLQYFDIVDSFQFDGKIESNIKYLQEQFNSIN